MAQPDRQGTHSHSLDWEFRFSLSFIALCFGELWVLFVVVLHELQCFGLYGFRQVFSGFLLLHGFGAGSGRFKVHLEDQGT